MPLRYVDPTRPTTAVSRAFTSAIASNYGGDRNPQWYHNLIAHPECELGGEAFRATEVTDPAEYARLYGLAEQAYAGYADYKEKTALVGRHIPILRLTPLSLGR